MAYPKRKKERNKERNEGRKEIFEFGANKICNLIYYIFQWKAESKVI
jgi:hypothetical protein